MNALIYPFGQVLGSGQIKQQPEDFQVTEELGFECSGSGEHLFLLIEKTSMTTQQMIERVACKLDVNPRHIGYSGLKDKHAVTRQWISVQLPGCRKLPVIEADDNWQVLQSTWHDRKLRIGSHRSNRFEILVRNVTAHQTDMEQRCVDIQQQGFANYFGTQRFGAAQDNVAQALRQLNHRHTHQRLSRHKKSLFLSALRSELFNRILNQRLVQEVWQRPLNGDMFMLAGSQSVFIETLNDALVERYRQFDIHSALSLFGSGESRLAKQALLLEEAVLADAPEICQTLLDNKIKRSFRANRALAHNLSLAFNSEAATMTLQVELAKGVYLTTLLQHLLDLEFTASGFTNF